MKVGLTEVHVVSEESEGCIKGVCPEELDDLKTIHKMMELACLLKCPHLGLDDILRELASSLRHHCDNDVDAVDLEIKTSDARFVWSKYNDSFTLQLLVLIICFNV